MSDTSLSSIAQVHVEDVARVRSMLRSAIREASAAWLPADAILDALALELSAFAGRHVEREYVAALLQRLANHYGNAPDERRH